ncbi:hypothetical protein D3C73_1251340 [compost metagenome]
MQGAALRLQIAWQPPLQPLQLQFGSGQQLADVVMQFAAKVLAFAFLDFEHAIGQFCRAQADRPGTLAQVPADPEHCYQMQQHQAGRYGMAAGEQQQVGKQRRHAQQCSRPAQHSGEGAATQSILQAWEHRGEATVTLLMEALRMSCRRLWRGAFNICQVRVEAIHIRVTGIC